MLAIHKLYPQYSIVNDRRKQSSPVEFDRRSGIDRRSPDRVQLDTGLTRDIFEIKSKVSQLQNTAQKKAENITFTQNAPKIAQNNLKTDQFIRTTKPESTNQNSPSNIASESSAASAAGALACVFGGIIAASCLGSVGAGMAIGLSTYFGGKVFKEIIVSHLKK